MSIYVRTHGGFKYSTPTISIDGSLFAPDNDIDSSSFSIEVEGVDLSMCRSSTRLHFCSLLVNTSFKYLRTETFYCEFENIDFPVEFSRMEKNIFYGYDMTPTRPTLVRHLGVPVDLYVRVHRTEDV